MINLHIIGVQKAGTTALAHFLQQHPAIYIVDGKEAHIFDHPDLGSQVNKTAFIERKYQQRLSHYKNQKITGDATPITLFQNQFLEECYQYNPDAKFIVMLRDPVARAESQYHMSRKNGLENRCMFWAFVLEPIRLRGFKHSISWSFDSKFRNQSYLRRGCYTKQLKHLYQLVPKKQILVLYQGELIHSHQKTMLKVFEFLDVHRHQIMPATIFKTERKKSHWSDPIARFYAKLYFKLKNETPEQWNSIIQAPLSN